jgi:2,3-bisphosphoglycerate-dependent phosphoglycerate mutase
MQHLDEEGAVTPARSRLARQMRGDGGSITLILVRHASTAMNSDEPGTERVRGWMDLPLSRAGKAEAEATARQLRKTDLDLAFCSDLVRARDTAKAIAKVCGCEVIELRALRPWDLGRFTGRPVSEANAEIEEFACRKPDARVPDGESFDTFRSRLFGGLKSIVGFNAAEPAIIMHNITERTLKSWVAAGMPATWKCDPKTLTAKGLSTSAVEKLTIDPAALRAVK